MSVETIRGTMPEAAEGGAEDLWIRATGCRTHNLQNITVALPRDKLVVITGLSGSGKSSLAFDTLYAEGQRRYIESLSSYARQFIEQMPRPDCDRITGLPPTIAIEQHPGAAGAQSTVATTTEIYDFLRLLFARAGTPHCPGCGREIRHQTLEQIAASIDDLPALARVTLLAPLVRGRKGHYHELFERIRADGYVKARVDGQLRDLDEVDRLERYKMHDIDVVVDRLVIKRRGSSRLIDSVRTAVSVGRGVCIALLEDGREMLFNQRFACTECNLGIEEPTPNLFSFNSPYGRCPACRGRGTVDGFDPELIVPDPDLSIAQGAVEPFATWGGRTGRRLQQGLRRLAGAVGADMKRPFKKLSARARKALLAGEGLAEGKGRGPKGRRVDADRDDAVIPALERLMEATSSESTRGRLMRYMSPSSCPDCKGSRLRPEALAVRVGSCGIDEITRMSVSEALGFFEGLSFSGARAQIAAPVLKEIRQRLGFLMAVGLHYLTGSRLTGTLSTGEAQRTRLATQIGSGLTGVCYVLDEPSIGLHPRDHDRLLDALERLRDRGNTVVVVEHDEATIRRADWVLDLGPGAGRDGGRVVYSGPFERITTDSDGLTAQYLTGAKTIPVPERRRRAKGGRWLTVRRASEHNLKNVDVRFPLGTFICVTGVSGSGKSTLVNDILLCALRRRFYRSSDKPGRHRSIAGADHIDKVLDIDQAPIGKTPRSTPATYTKVLDEVRRLFAQTRQAQIRGYGPARFSFNVRGGRCEACRGMGYKTIEMSFLPDMRVRCEACGGARYNEETLHVMLRGRNMADVLAMTVEEALDFFRHHGAIERRLRTMREVGIGYLTLGQPSPTLSGGEAQRIKLARELGKLATGNTLYCLDEPTTGLHFDDVGKLLATLHGLVAMGNTLVVIEHNLEVIKNADHVIDLGPEGGDEGGCVVATGTPEEIAASKTSHTGRALRMILKKK